MIKYTCDHCGEEVEESNWDSYELVVRPNKGYYFYIGTTTLDTVCANKLIDFLRECMNRYNHSKRVLNKKNEEVYLSLGEVINCTNEVDGQEMIIYTKEDKLFVREKKEFEEKFKELPTKEKAIKPYWNNPISILLDKLERIVRIINE